jgi:hypothetical protein
MMYENTPRPFASFPMPVILGQSRYSLLGWKLGENRRLAGPIVMGYRPFQLTPIGRRGDAESDFPHFSSSSARRWTAPPRLLSKIPAETPMPGADKIRLNPRRLQIIVIAIFLATDRFCPCARGAVVFGQRDGKKMSVDSPLVQISRWN